MEGYVMAESAYHFRSSLGGFHKGDVTAYIEKTAMQHRTELLSALWSTPHSSCL